VATRGVDIVSAQDTKFSTLLFAGNSYYALNNTFSINWGGWKYSSLDAWRKASNQEVIGGQIVGIEGNPLMWDIGNGPELQLPQQLHLITAYRLLANSPLVNAGLNLGKLFKINIGSHDFIDLPLSQNSTVDIGAIALSANMVSDGSFEFSSIAWVHSSQNAVIHNAEDVHSGSAALRIAPGGITVQEIAGIRPNTSYVLSAWTKLTNASQQGWVYIRHNGKQYSFSGSSTSYEAGQVMFTSEVNMALATTIEISMASSVISDLYFFVDDVKLVKM